MNETLQNALAEIILAALENAEAAKEFVLAEMPDVVQQLLVWKAAQSLLMLALTLLFFSAPLFARKIAIANDGDSFDQMMAMVLGGIGGMIIGSLPARYALDWLQIWLAPKIYLIEYAADLVK